MDRYGISAGVRVVKDLRGNIVGTGVCCNGVTNKILPVVNSCEGMCEYKLDISRSDHGSNKVSFTRTVTGVQGETFKFSGCSSTHADGQSCKSKWGVSAGVRVVKNSVGEIVSTGTCCNGVTKKILKVTSSCDK